jgi:LacI family transcriptional regulator
MLQTERIGLVFGCSLAYCRGILRGIRDFAQGKPRWVLMPVRPEPEAVRELRRFRPSGIIAHAFSRELVEAVQGLGRPWVTVYKVEPDEALPRVGVDNVRVGEAAAAHLLDRGFRHFAFVGHRDYPYSVEREAGFRRTIERVGHSLNRYLERDQIQFHSMGNLWALDPRIHKWARSLPKPVGIFATNDIWGLQLAEVCRQVGLRVPEDVALVGVDNDDLLCELARPSLSSVALPLTRIGHEAAALLDRLLAGAEPPAGPLLFPPTKVEVRQSSDVLAMADRDVAEAVSFIREHGDQPIQVRDVLRAVPVCRRTLERHFRQSLNRGLWEEIRRVHLERAKSLLADTEVRIGTVAERAGFSDPKQLSVVFRQETGLTPTEYRRKFRG